MRVPELGQRLYRPDEIYVNIFSEPMAAFVIRCLALCVEEIDGNHGSLQFKRHDDYEGSG